MRKVALARRPYKLKRVAIRRRSKKREAAYSGPTGRRAFVAAYLEEHPICEVQALQCENRAVHVHEPLPRSAMGSITDPDNALAVCFICHRRIHDQPKWAKEEGWLI